MSIREQERRQKESERRIDERVRRLIGMCWEASWRGRRRPTSGPTRSIERIEKGGVDPRPLPGLREDSMASMESMPSMESSPSMGSIESAETVSGVTGEAEQSAAQEDMPLEGAIPYDPASAEEDSPKGRPRRLVRGATYTCTTSARPARWRSR